MTRLADLMKQAPALMPDSLEQIAALQLGAVGPRSLEQQPDPRSIAGRPADVGSREGAARRDPAHARDQIRTASGPRPTCTYCRRGAP